MDIRALRSTGFWAIVGLAFGSHTAVTAITIRETTSNLRATRSYGTGLAGSVMDVITLALLLGAVASRRLSTSRPVLFGYSAAAGMISLVAALLSIYVLSWSLTHPTVNGSIHTSVAGITLAAIAILCEAMFYTYMLWPQKQASQTPTLETLEQRPSPARSAKRVLSIHLASLAPASPSFLRSYPEPYSPGLSAPSTSPRSSLRSSLQHALRPMTSKSRLLPRLSFVSNDSRSPHMSRPMSTETTRRDGFETWDTSAVEEVPEVPPIPKVTRARLEPIPGSRPVSPAKILDGPFPDEAVPEGLPLPDSPLHSPLQSPLTSPPSETSSMRSFPFPPLRRPSTSQSQSHIHPLFRSESPVPPPIASPGTVIVASPHAGQVVSPDHALSPPMMHSAQFSPGMSRPGSFRSLRLQSASPVDGAPASRLHETHDAV